MEQFLTREPTKFIISEVPEKLDQYLALLRAKLTPQLYLTRSRPIFLEILHPAVSKVEGLKVLGERLGIGLSEMMAIGDAHNDIEMLQGVGLGVAMGNAPPEVQAQADWVTAGIEDEGVVVALEKFILRETGQINDITG
ncbi:MAG TPA: HAD hydrolase family protein [Firmicutes bacterium]|nr:HAD hydrolase family protein [Bacillota bacterium]